MSSIRLVLRCAVVVCLWAMTLTVAANANGEALDQQQYVATTTPASTDSTKAPSRYVFLHPFGMDDQEYYNMSFDLDTSKASRTTRRLWRAWNVLRRINARKHCRVFTRCLVI